jgi:P4 family phage/plasmid primase-like protien
MSADRYAALDGEIAARGGPSAVVELAQRSRARKSAAPGEGRTGQAPGRKRTGAGRAIKVEADAAPATHFELAQRWISMRTVQEHRPVYCGGMFFVGQPDGLWGTLSIERVETEVAAMFGAEKLCRRGSDYRQIAHVCASSCDDPRFFDAAPLGMVTAKGFHQVESAGVVRTVSLSLDHRQVFRLAWVPDDEAAMPLFDGLLRTAFAGDDCEEQMQVMQEVFGAVLLGLLPKLQRVALFLGKEGSGKSTLQRLVERLFPPEAVSAVSPFSWSKEYSVAALMGRRLNVVGELSDDAPIPAASFKNVTGQNLIEGRHPTHRPFFFTCTASHLFASNVLPPTTDRSDAMFRRWVILVFKNRVQADAIDPDLLDKIVAAEVPAILAWAIKGAERVSQAGRLHESAAQRAAIGRWKAAANPVLQFLLDPDSVELDRTAYALSTRTVYEQYRRWSSQAGFRNPFGRNHFLELLDSTGAQVGVAVKHSMVHGMRLLVDQS